MGGPIAQLMARDHADTVAGIVLCATSSQWKDFRQQRPVARHGVRAAVARPRARLRVAQRPAPRRLPRPPDHGVDDVRADPRRLRSTSPRPAASCPTGTRANGSATSTSRAPSSSPPRTPASRPPTSASWPACSTRRPSTSRPTTAPPSPPTATSTASSSPRSPPSATSSGLSCEPSRAVSSAGQSACLTSRRSPVRAWDRPSDSVRAIARNPTLLSFVSRTDRRPNMRGSP